MRMIPLALAIALFGCATAKGAQAPATTTPARAPAADTSHTATYGPGALSEPNADPFPSTYKPFPSKPTIIRNVTILTAAGPRIEHAVHLIADSHDSDSFSDRCVCDGRFSYDSACMNACV